MKFFLTFLISIFLFFYSAGQIEGEQQPGGDIPGMQIRTSRLYGKLVDHNTGKGIDAAAIQLFRVGNDSLITGMLTKPNGDFSFDEIDMNVDWKMVVTAIGYEPIEQIIEAPEEERRRGPREKDLGNLELQPKVRELGGVTVVANRPVMELGVDRRVFNVSKMLTTAGGTAIDLLRNIPSVSVDIEGNIQLRNSSPQIFVDGRPTILTPDQIPADNIEKVELITNPSAKFDAASSGGIINIVLKKNKRFGINGIATASVGAPRVANGNLNLNLRQGKFNFFLVAGLYNSGGNAKGETRRENKSGNTVTDYFNQHTSNKRTRRFRTLRFGTDYFVDNRNSFTLSQDFNKGQFGNDEFQYQEYLDASKIMEYSGQRLSISKYEFNRSSTRLNYKHNFPKAGRELTADITYNQGSNSERSEIENTFSYPDGSEYRPPSNVKNDGDGNNDQVTLQADYVHPFREDEKLEAGIRFYHNRSESKFNAFSVANNTSTKLPLSNNYESTEAINAAYITYSGKKDRLSYQFGLRAEQSKLTGLLIDSALKFGYKYPSGGKNIWNALFPSVFFTRQLGEDDQLQLNYSRRIRRPRFWHINPFIDIQDPVNLRQGNPQLKPEFINSFELNYSGNYAKGNFLASAYFRNNPDDITQYSDTISAAQYQELQTAGVDPNAILNTFINAGVTNRYGAELVWQLKPGKNLNITPSFELQYRTVKASVGELDLSNKGFNWEARLNSDYRIETKGKSIFNQMGFQLSAEYESGRVIPQGRRKPQYGIDFAIRKDFMKDKKATVTASINDIFNTQRFGIIYDTETFYQDSYRRWNVRNFRITFSYKFGKANFSLLHRGNRGGGDDD